MPVADLDDAAIERVMQVNFHGALQMVRAFLPVLLARPEAHIANVSSMGGFFPFPGQTIYGASKAAVKLLTEGLYAELLDPPVRVSVIMPGATAALYVGPDARLMNVAVKVAPGPAIRFVQRQMAKRGIGAPQPSSR